MRLNPAMAKISELLGLGRAALLSAPGLIVLSVALAAYWFFRSAPPTTITMTSGPEGSRFHTNAELYRLALARHGVKLVNLPSHGSLDNLRRLSDPSFIVDVGFVQGGLTNASGGSIAT